LNSKFEETVADMGNVDKDKKTGKKVMVHSLTEERTKFRGEKGGWDV